MAHAHAPPSSSMNFAHDAPGCGAEAFTQAISSRYEPSGKLISPLSVTPPVCSPPYWVRSPTRSNISRRCFRLGPAIVAWSTFHSAAIITGSSREQNNSRRTTLFHDRLRRRLVAVFVFDAHRNGVFAWGGVLQHQVVIELQRIRQPACWSHDGPVAAVDRVFRLADFVQFVGRLPMHLEVRAAARGFEPCDRRRRVVDQERIAFHL